MKITEQLPKHLLNYGNVIDGCAPQTTMSAFKYKNKEKNKNNVLSLL